jgi:tight adherence protein B
MVQIRNLLTRRQRRLQDRLRIAAGAGPSIPSHQVAGSNPVVAMPKKRLRLPSIPALGSVIGKRYMDRIRVDLTKAGIPLKPEELAGMAVVFSLVGACVGLLARRGPLPAVLLASAGGILPGLWVKEAKKKRGSKVEVQLVDSLTLIANSLRAGHSFMQALELVSRDSMPPLAPELARVIRESRLGVSVDEAFGNLVARFESRDLELAVTGVLIQRQVGGNLALVLDNIAGTIEKRLKARGKVRTLTAQGRVSAWVISIMPFAMATLVFGFYPDFGHVMLSTPLGLGMLGVAAVSLAIGIFLIRKVVSIDV